MRCTEWFDDYKVISGYDALASSSFRLKILEGGTLLYGGVGRDGEAGHATGPAHWTAVAIPADRSIRRDRQHLRLGLDGAKWCESFFVSWADDAYSRLEDAGLRPTDSTHRMKILANGMLLFQHKDDAGLLLAAANTWVLAKGPWGDPTKTVRKKP